MAQEAQLGAGSARAAYDAAVFAQHRDAVLQRCRARTSCREDAEDAFQETFLRFHRRNKGTLQDPLRWLLVVASRACADVYRRRTRSERLACAARRELSPDPEAEVVNRAFVVEVLNGLESRQREVLTALYLEGEPPDHLARRLRVTPGNLRVVALRGRRAARNLAIAMDRTLGGLVGIAACRRLLHRIRLALRRRGQSIAGHPAIAQLQTDTASVLVVMIGLLPAGTATVHGGGPGRPVGGWSPPPPRALMADPAPASGLTDGVARRDQTRALAGAAALLDRAGSNAGSSPAAAPWRQLGDSRGARQPGAVPIGSLSAPGGPADGRTRGILPDRNAPQYDAAFSSMTSAPDGTTLASGTLMHCAASCSVVFRSADLGHTWQHLASQGFLGGRVILPPGYPTRPTIFAAGSGGLQQSDDGGDLFHTVSPVVASATVDPRSPPGQARIVLSSLPLTVYEEGTGLVTPGPLLPPATRGVSDVAFNAQGDLLVTGTQVSPTGRGQVAAMVALCPGGSSPCEVISSPSTASSFYLSVPPFPAGNHLVSMFAANWLFVSTDDGRHFQGGRLTGVRAVASATPAPDYSSTGALVVAGSAATTGTMILLRGPISNLVPISPTGLPADGLVSQVLELSSGRLLASLVLAGHEWLFGIRSSDDGGYTWGMG